MLPVVMFDQSHAVDKTTAADVLKQCEGKRLPVRVGETVIGFVTGFRLSRDHTMVVAEFRQEGEARST